MNAQRIDLVLVEKATSVRVFGLPCAELGPGKHDFIAVADLEEVLGVVFDEPGLKEERKPRWTDGNRHLLTPDGRTVEAVRLVSDWRPVEQGDTK